MPEQHLNTEYQNETHAYRWLWASFSFIQLIVAYYVFAYDEYTHPLFLTNMAIFFISQLFFLLRLGRKKVVQGHYLKGALTLSALNWIMLAVIIHYIWGETLAAERVLLMGFFVTLICFSSNTLLLIISVAPFIIAKFIFEIKFLDYSGIDLLLSTIVFPMFVIVTIFTTLDFNRKLKQSHKQIVELNEELTDLKNTDPLTGLNNRRVFDEQLKFAIGISQRIDHPFALLILDIDYFKNFNDALGHPEGDKCLIEFSALLKNKIKRQSDVIARIGGEEFAIILSSVDKAQTVNITNSILDALNALAMPHPDSSVDNVVTVSVGIAHSSMFESNALTSKEIYKKADEALYQAKSNGRKGYSF